MIFDIQAAEHIPHASSSILNQVRTMQLLTFQNSHFFQINNDIVGLISPYKGLKMRHASLR